MNKIINYFLENAKLNYTLLVFLLVMGIFAYNNIPKQMFPSVTLDSISISGSYSGASADNLNSFAVTEIENEIDGISGIKEVTATIRSERFTITLDLQDGVDKNTVLNDVKDAVDMAKQYFPSDMNDPTVSADKREESLLNVSLSSKNRTQQELINISKSLKTTLLQVDGITNTNIFGNSDLEIDIFIDTKKINLYGISSTSLITSLQELSYLYPVGTIEQTGNHVYLTADNNKFDIQSWLNTLLNIADKKVFLKDIAQITIGYPTGESISRLNGNQTIYLEVYKSADGDAVSIAKQVKAKLANFEESMEDINLIVSRDSSVPLSERINTLISNITLGLILVAIAMYILISPRLSLVIVMGIPFSFIIALLIIEQLGYSLNMISLMAMLITLGIVVDDAIVISENIQRHIDNGDPIKEAVLNGTKEMVPPVLIASFTTMFAFMPMLLISGQMGLLMQLVPIVVTAVIFASLIESFIFLPLHAKHMLKRKDKLLDWTPVHNFYERVLHKVIKSKKIFLAIFLVTVPLLTIFLIQQSRFQMMPDMDSNNVTVSIKFDESKSLEESDALAKKYEKVLLEKAKELYIENINTTVGQFSSISNDRESIENGFMLALELEDLREDNFLENYVNPILSLSFEFGQKDKLRLIDTSNAKEKIRKLLEPIIQLDKVVAYNIVSSRIGIVKTDIELKLSHLNQTLLMKNVEKLKEELLKIKGVTDVSDNLKLGDKEYKYSVNTYGQTLGLTDRSIASALSSYLMEKEQANTFNESGIINIVTQSIYKDSLDELKHFLIPVGEQYVELDEVVDFRIVRNFEKIEKEDGNIYKKVYANADKRVTSGNEILNEINPILKELEKNGLIVKLGGEKEKSSQLASDLIKAFTIAIFLIFLTLLVNFKSFKSSFVILSVIPFTIFGAILGHFIMGVNLNSQSLIGMLGLAGVVINDGIIMLDFLKDTKNKEEFFHRAKQRVRPILITSITTVLGLVTLIFFPVGQSIMLQPIAISLGFGLLWGTVLNLVYVPALYATLFKIKD
ncbi:efflux RND transporter permease subunit [Arcobacter sp. 15-2]|uniref:efflux RND transporter permease subunit n=1 Tax=Arcobacter sp. 15-2 TaxID=3374109 RepID=UPI00399D26D0